MEQMSQAEPAGNTIAAVIPVTQIYRFCWTLFTKDPCEPDEPERLHLLLSGHCKLFTFQLERSASGRLHFQGTASLVTKHRLSEIKNILGDDTVHVSRCKDWAASIKYCSKADTRIAGPWDHNSVFIRTIKVLRAWQAELRDLLVKPCDDDRVIYWIWDKHGNIGKTAFSKYMGVMHGAIVLNNGKTADIAYCLPNDPKIIIFNLPRAVEDRFNYTVLENVKDGLIFSGKYESRTKIFNSPHVVIFANWFPDVEEMSKDRWCIIEL